LKLNPFRRDQHIEQALGHNLPGNFPVIDKSENGLATRIKNLDLDAATLVLRHRTILISLLRSGTHRSDWGLASPPHALRTFARRDPATERGQAANDPLRTLLD
jgi:hypothetical protein